MKLPSSHLLYRGSFLGLLIVVAMAVSGVNLSLGASGTWEQTDWTGGTDGGSGAVHPTNQTGWNQYSSITNLSDTDSPGNVTLSTSNFTATDDGTFTTTGLASGGGFANGTTSSTTVSGSGDDASVGLTGISTPVDTFETPFPPVPDLVSDGGAMIRNATDDDIYVLQGYNNTGFFKYTVSTNSWTTLSAVPGLVRYGGTMIRNGADNDIYVLQGNTSTGFYKYSISGNSWTTLSAVPGLVQFGGTMIRNGADNDIYVLQGNSTTGFYKYSISGNSWTTLTVVPGAVSSGATMLRNGADDDIYVLQGNSTGFYKYSISGNSWTTLTVVPGTVSYGGTMIRNGADNDIYVLRGGTTTGFYKYSISGNSWTTLTVVPGTVSTGGTLLRNGADDDIYVLRGSSTGFYKYSISGNSWTTLTFVPHKVYYGGTMIRNGADDDIYVLNGGGSNGFNKYSITNNSWTGSNISSLAPVPGGIDTGGTMIRNGADNDIYVLRGGNSTGFYKYFISGNSWTTLTVVPGSVGIGGQMIRNGADNDIYVLRGANSTGFHKYSISGNSWTTLTAVPSAVQSGGTMMRNGADDDIYVLKGNISTGFYKYSISGNSWTTLTAVPGTVGYGATMIRNGADDDVYVLQGNSTTGFYKYSISGNSWTTLTVVPGTLSSGATMIRNGADNDIYVLRGGGYTSFYKYSISGNSWTTLTVVPKEVGNGGTMIRYGADNDIYVVSGFNSSSSPSGLYKYSISGNSWTTLAAVPGVVANGGTMIRNGSDPQIYILPGFKSTNLFRYTIDSTAYPTTGTFTSAVIDTAGVTAFGNLSWTPTLPASTTLTLATRSGATATPDGTWSAWSSETSTSAGSGIASPAARYIQYRGSFATSDTTVTPTLADITAAYNAYHPSGNLVSSSYDSIDATNQLGGLSWTEDASLPLGATVTVSLRTASTAGGLTGSWTDFTNATADCSKIADTVTCTSSAMPATLTSGGDDQYVQYKVALGTTNTAATSTVGSVTTAYGVQDTTAPLLTEVTPVPSQTDDNTPDYTFDTDEAGTITYSGDCTSSTTNATLGDNTITFDILTDGAHTNCTVLVTDAYANVSLALSISPFTVDTLSPTLVEVASVPTPDNDSTPDYTFSSTEAGTITYGGDCSSATTDAVVGDNTVSFATLADGMHSNCTIRVTDALNNASTLLNVSSFMIDATSPLVSQVTPVPTPTNDNTPAYAFSSTEAGTIIYGGVCSSTTTNAVVGDNTVVLDALADGTYSNCTLTITDAVGNVSSTLNFSSFTVDTTAVTLTEVTPVPSPTNDNTPSYTFDSDQAGTITYGGACSSSTTSATAGNNTVVFNTLFDGLHSDCTMFVTDDALNVSTTLPISPFTVDTVTPLITEVTPVSTPNNDNTPSYTFNSSEAGAITYGGNCSSLTSSAILGMNTVTFTTLADGIHGNCTVVVTDAADNASSTLNISSFSIDSAAPLMSEVTPVTIPNDNTPSYTFHTDEAGSITYGGDCSSVTAEAVMGDNTVIFDLIEDGLHSNCTLVVTDVANNVSNLLQVSPFTINRGRSAQRRDGTINVVKTVINNNGGTKTFGDFSLFVNGIGVSSGTTNTFPANGGTYMVTETSDANYLPTFSGDCASDGSMDLGSGNTRLCVITNDDIAGPEVVSPIPSVIAVTTVPNPLSLPSGPGLVRYSYAVRNIGLVAISEVTLGDDSCDPVNLVSGDTNDDGKLDVNETWIYQCSARLSETHTNTVVVSGWANGLSATDIASATVVVGGSLPPPLIHVTKVPRPLVLPAGGGLVTYTEKITNPGTVPLTNVVLRDDKCGGIKFVSGDTNGDQKLDPEETWSYTCRMNLVVTTTNTATATGRANGLRVRDSAIVTVVVAIGTSASKLVNIALLEHPDNLNYLQDQFWWNSADLSIRQQAYVQMNSILGSAQALADYVSSNGIQNLQNYSWWSSNPFKHQAWSIVLQG